MIQVRLIISGKVQGVGFRFYVKSYADDLKVNGWVRNTSSGEVEVLLQGEKKSVEKVIELSNKGPRFAVVSKVLEYKEEVTKLYTDFRITE